MFKPTALIFICLSVLPVFQATRSLAEISESNPPTQSANQQSDTVNSRMMQRSPEAIEREQARVKERRQDAREEQLEWRRKYGDLAPSRQRPVQ
jgi:hypothetical protein